MLLALESTSSGIDYGSLPKRQLNMCFLAKALLPPSVFFAQAGVRENEIKDALHGEWDAAYPNRQVPAK